MNNIIIEKVDDLINFIKQSKDYEEYLFLINKLKENNKVLEYINKIKQIQKEIVKKEINGEDITNLNIEVKELLDKLNRIPLYVQYINKQNELNEEYQIIKNALDDYFYELLN